MSITYGAVPPIAKTWVKMTANPATIAATSDKVITVVLVNTETGFCIAEGHATQVAGA